MSSPTIKRAIMDGVQFPFTFGFAFDVPQYSDRAVEIVVRTEDVADPSTKDDLAASTSGESLSKRPRHSPPEDTDDSDATGTKEQLYKAVQVSSLLLSAQSPFFNTLFTNGMRESQQQAVKLVCADDKEAEVTLLLLRLMYYQSVEGVMGTTQNNDTLLQLALLAERYQAQHCLTLCDDALARASRSIGECTHLLAACRPPDFLPQTLQACSSQIQQHFSYLDLIWGTQSLQQEFLNLNATALQVLLDSDKVCVSEESTVWRLLVLWCADKGIEAYSHDCKELLKSVRYEYMAVPYLTSEVMFHPLVDNTDVTRRVSLAVAHASGAHVCKEALFKQWDVTWAVARPRPRPGTELWDSLDLPRGIGLLAEGGFAHELEFNVEELMDTLHDGRCFMHPTRLLVDGYLVDIGVELTPPDKLTEDSKPPAEGRDEENAPAGVHFFLEFAPPMPSLTECRYAMCLWEFDALGRRVPHVVEGCIAGLTYGVNIYDFGRLEQLSTVHFLDGHPRLANGSSKAALSVVLKVDHKLTASEAQQRGRGRY